MELSQPDATGPNAPEPDPVEPRAIEEAAPGPDLGREEEERLIDELISRGEAVPEGTELPPGATHEVYHDDQGRRHLRRKRFSAL